MITDLNCVDCEIHVIKLEVNLTNFTGLWRRNFQYSTVFSVCNWIVCPCLSIFLHWKRSVSCVSLPTSVIGLLKASHTSLSYDLLILSPFFPIHFSFQDALPHPSPLIKWAEYLSTGTLPGLSRDWLQTIKKANTIDVFFLRFKVKLKENCTSPRLVSRDPRNIDGMCNRPELAALNPAAPTLVLLLFITRWRRTSAKEKENSIA